MSLPNCTTQHNFKFLADNVWKKLEIGNERWTKNTLFKGYFLLENGQKKWFSWNSIWHSKLHKYMICNGWLKHDNSFQVKGSSPKPTLKKAWARASGLFCKTAMLPHLGWKSSNGFAPRLSFRPTRIRSSGCGLRAIRPGLSRCPYWRMGSKWLWNRPKVNKYTKLDHPIFQSCTIFYFISNKRNALFISYLIEEK